MQKTCTCGRYHNRAVSIDALILKEDKILLIKRGFDPYKGFWAIPGGHLDYDETVKDAVRREVKEETNLDVTSLSLVDVYSSPSRSPLQTVAIAYKVEVQGEAKYGSDAIDLAFFSLDDLPDCLAFDHKQIIEDYRKKI